MSGHVSCLRLVIGAKCLLCRDVGPGRKGLDFKAAQAWTSNETCRVLDTHDSGYRFQG